MHGSDTKITFGENDKQGQSVPIDYALLPSNIKQQFACDIKLKLPKNM